MESSKTEFMVYRVDEFGNTVGEPITRTGNPKTASDIAARMNRRPDVIDKDWRFGAFRVTTTCTTEVTPL